MDATDVISQDSEVQEVTYFDELEALLGDPDFRADLRASGIEPFTLTYVPYAAWNYQSVSRATGIKYEDLMNLEGAVFHCQSIDYTGDGYNITLIFDDLFNITAFQNIRPPLRKYDTFVQVEEN